MKHTLIIMSALVVALSFPQGVRGQSDTLGAKLNENFVASIQPGLLEQARNPETSVYDYMIVCKRLAVYGDRSAIPVLVPMLSDANKAHWARTTLEAMPFEEAVTALREAVPQVEEPVLRAGLLTSLGLRDDVKSVPVLLPFLKDQNATVAAAAAFALARIAAPAYSDAMVGALAGKNSDLLLMYGDFLRRKGHEDAAEKVFFAIGDTGEKPFYKEAAFYQILLRADGKADRWFEPWLTGECDVRCAAALRAAQFVRRDAVTVALIAAYAKVSDSRKPAILAGLGDQRNLRAQPTLAAALTSENPEIQSAALLAMRSFAEMAVFEDLVKTALSGDAEVKVGVLAVVKSLPESTDEKIVALFNSSDLSTKEFAVQMAAARKMSSLNAEIFQLAKSGSGTLKLVSISALGEVLATSEQFAYLVDLSQSSESDVRAAAQTGLTLACGLVSDRAAAVQKLEQAADASKGKPELRLFLFQTLGKLGGAGAVEVVAKAALSEDDEARDLATNVMGRWYDTDVAPILIQLANTPDYPYATRALRGYLRLAKQFAMPASRRVAIVRSALLSPACGDSERELAAVIVKQYALDMNLQISDVQMAIWNLCVESAIFGVPNQPENQKDVTGKVRSLLQDSRSLTLEFPDGYNKFFDGDPAPGISKRLILTVRNGVFGESKTILVNENGKIDLSVFTK